MKTRSTKQMIVRRIVGSVLASDLTPKEIEYLSNDLIHADQLAVEIGYALRMHLRLLNHGDDIHQVIAFQNDSNGIEHMLEKIREKRITKMDVLNSIPENLLDAASIASLKKMPLRELLIRAFENAPQSSINQFIRQVGIEEDQDPYLMGIEKKR